MNSKHGSEDPRQTARALQVGAQRLRFSSDQAIELANLGLSEAQIAALHQVIAPIRAHLSTEPTKAQVQKILTKCYRSITQFCDAVVPAVEAVATLGELVDRVQPEKSTSFLDDPSGTRHPLPRANKSIALAVRERLENEADETQSVAELIQGLDDFLGGLEFHPQLPALQGLRGLIEKALDSARAQAQTRHERARYWPIKIVHQCLAQTTTLCRSMEPSPTDGSDFRRVCEIVYETATGEMGWNSKRACDAYSAYLKHGITAASAGRDLP